MISRDSDTTAVNEGDGVSSDPAISADGRFVAFVSQSTNLVDRREWAASLSAEIVKPVRRRLVSRNTAGLTASAGNRVNTAPAISSDGQFIAFVSNATNLVTGISVASKYTFATP